MAAPGDDAGKRQGYRRRTRRRIDRLNFVEDVKTTFARLRESGIDGLFGALEDPVAFHTLLIAPGTAQL
jgi:hypothetical protein